MAFPAASVSGAVHSEGGRDFIAKNGKWIYHPEVSENGAEHVPDTPPAYGGSRLKDTPKSAIRYRCTGIIGPAGTSLWMSLYNSQTGAWTAPADWERANGTLESGGSFWRKDSWHIGATTFNFAPFRFDDGGPWQLKQNTVFGIDVMLNKVVSGRTSMSFILTGFGDLTGARFKAYGSAVINIDISKMTYISLTSDAVSTTASLTEHLEVY